MARRWRDLLSEFDQITPPEDLWHRAVSRNPQRRGRRLWISLPGRPVHAAVAAAVILAALGGMLFASLLHEGSTAERPARPASRVGADTWLEMLVYDIGQRIPLARELVSRDQCFTPQWTFLAAPVYNDLAAYRAISSRADARIDFGQSFVDVNNQCNTYARQGGVSPRQRTVLLGRLDALAAEVHAQRASLPPKTSIADASIALLLGDLRTRVPVARRLIDRGQCGREVERLALPVQSDLDIALLYFAPRTHTLAEGVARQQLIQLGPDFMRVTGNCYADVHAGQLGTRQRQSLLSQLRAIISDINRVERR